MFTYRTILSAQQDKEVYRERERGREGTANEKVKYLARRAHIYREGAIEGEHCVQPRQLD